MPDKGHKMTDDMIVELEQKLHNLYAKADSDLQKKAASRLKKYNETVKVKEKTLDKDAFETWKKNQAYMLSNQKNLIDTIAEDLVKTDQIALDIINNHTPSAYALNYNYGTYQIEDAGKINTSFALYNHDTVELLALYDDSSLLPEPKNLDIPKDLQWNKKHLSQAISQGVLQGESIDKIAKRLSAAVGMDENGAIRNARTMMTAAQNGGRVDAYLRGKAMGIELRQKWQATEDSRTRKSHRAIDGEIIEVGEEFSNHCHFPGDPAGPGREVYNCRCTLIPLVNGIKDFNPLSNDKYLKKGFEDWLEDQADPFIVSKFGNKSMSAIYHELKDMDKSVGNAFKSQLLKKMGNPSDVWKQYIDGTLDAANTKKIDDYLFKHFNLNANKLDDAVKTVDKVDDITDVVKAADKIDDLDDHALFLNKWKDVDLWADEVPGNAFEYAVKNAPDADHIEDYWKKYTLGEIKDSKLDELLGYTAKTVDKIDDVEDHAKFLEQWKDAKLSQDLSFEAYKHVVNNPLDIIDEYDYWNKYISGQIKDPELDKLLGYKKATDKVDDVADIIKDTESKIKWNKGKPMSTADADNHKVNPLYNIEDVATKTNCQTSAFAYECRKQGYDVVALPTYKTDSFKHIYKKQVEISQDQSVAWINKVTGKPPKSIYKGSANYKDIDNIIGKSGERYSISVKFNDGTYHIINLDRDSTGKLRLIDNQRGPSEVNIWTGEKEITEYFKKLDDIDSIHRLDDCVPNFEYLNVIVQDASKIKAVEPYNNLLHLSQQNPIATIAKKKGFDPEDYYNQWRLGFIEDKDLDEILQIHEDAKDMVKKAVTLDDKALKYKKSLSIQLNDLDDELAKDIDDIVSSKGESYWKKYIQGKIDDSELDEIIMKHADKLDDVAKIKKADDAIESGENKLEFLKNKYAIQADTTDATVEDMAEAIVDYFDDGTIWEILEKNVTDEIANSHIDYLEKYILGEIKDKDLDKAFGYKIKVETKTENKVLEAVKKKFPDVNNATDAAVKLAYNDPDGYKIFDKYITDNKLSDNAFDLAEKYFDGKVKIPEMDDYLGIKKIETKIPDADKPFSKKDLFVDYDSWGKLMDNISTIDHGDIYYEIGKTMQDLKQQFGTTYAETYKKYINGEINSDKLDNLFAKVFSGKYGGTFDADIPKVDIPKIDYAALSNKSMSAVYHELKDVDTKIGNAFKNELKKHGTPSEVFKQYLNGELSDDVTKKLDSYVIHKYSKGGTVKSVEKATEQTAEQKAKLKTAEEKLEKAKEKLNNLSNPTYTGIWKDDVTLADYETKKSTIKAKKIWYEDEIDKLKNDPSYKSWLSQTGKQDYIDEYTKHLNDLEDFETAGKKYAKAQKAVREAQNEVDKLSPVDAMYNQERKDAAIWAKNKTDDYERVDKIFDPHAREVHATRTKRERDAYKDYTGASGPFNKPLVGFDSPDGSGKAGWTEKYWKGSGNVDIDKRGRGDNIRALTDLVERSTYDFDFWMQTSQDFSTFEGFNGGGFLGIPYGTLQNMSDAELQQFVGKQSKLPQFISGAINKGGGSYNPGGVRMNIYVPKGSEALYVLEDGTFKKNEHEIILQRGGTYRVTKIYWGEDTVNGGKKLIIDVELRLEEGYDKFQQNKK